MINIFLSSPDTEVMMLASVKLGLTAITTFFVCASCSVKLSSWHYSPTVLISYPSINWFNTYYQSLIAIWVSFFPHYVLCISEDFKLCRAGMLQSKKCVSYLWCSINNTKLCSSKLPQSGAVLYPALHTLQAALTVRLKWSQCVLLKFTESLP